MRIPLKSRLNTWLAFHTSLPTLTRMYLFIVYISICHLFDILQIVDKTCQIDQLWQVLPWQFLKWCRVVVFVIGLFRILEARLRSTTYYKVGKQFFIIVHTTISVSLTQDMVP